MKFKFCGNIDCPEWLITEVAYLNKINAVKLRIVTSNICVNIISSENKPEKALKMLEEMGFSIENSQVICGMIHFIIKSSVKFEVDSVVLNQELQQLGLPQENADSIAKVFKSNFSSLKNSLVDSIFGHSTIKASNKQVVHNCMKESELEWKINYVLANNNQPFDKEILNRIKEEEDTGVKLTKLGTKIDIKLGNKYFSTNKEVLGKLINDLEKAAIIIKSYNNNK